MPERAEGQSKPHKLPLRPRSAFDAFHSLMYALKHFPPSRTEAYMGSILDEEIVPPDLRIFYEHHIEELPRKSVERAWYSVGFATALDSLTLDAVRKKARMPTVEFGDLQAYENVRTNLYEEGWFNREVDYHAHLIGSLTKLLKGSEEDFIKVLEDMLNFVIPGREFEAEFKRKLAFLTGMADCYFPYRNAFDREGIARGNN